MAKGAESWAKVLGQGQRPDTYQFWRPFFDQGMEAWSKVLTQGATPDLLQDWKKFQDAWIETWSKVLTQAMGTENFAAVLGKHLDQHLSAIGPARKQMAEVGEEMLRVLNLPSRRQIADLAELVVALESRIEALEDKIEALLHRERSAGD
jgi:polyhydroxyalkanoic acid synthase PhaR subunit